MLFTELPPQPPTPVFSHYAPAISSPLAPRYSSRPMPAHQNTNTASKPEFETFNFFAPPAPTPASSTSTSYIVNSNTNSQAQTSPSQSSTTKPNFTSAYAQRYATKISNPLKSYTSSTSPTGRDKRRNAFLNRIKQSREEGRFENRSERFMLLEHANERKAWGEEMKRRAEGIVKGFGLDDLPDFDAEDEDEMGWEEKGDDEAELDEYIRQERDMEMALLGGTPGMEMDGGAEGADRGERQGQGQEAARSSFSDEEYEGIFMDLADTEGMDMSSG